MGFFCILFPLCVLCSPNCLSNRFVKRLHSDSEIFFFDRPTGLPEQGCAISDMSHTHNTFPHDIFINRLEAAWSR